MDATPSRRVAKHSEQEKQLCSFCGDQADEAYSIDHRECGGRTHVDCLPAGKDINYKLCSVCTGEQVPLAAVASMDVTPPGGTSGREPFPPDGIDYVLNPGQKPARSGSAWQTIAGMLVRPIRGAPPAKQVEDVRTSQDPEFLLKNRVPVRDILRFNKLGLQHMLKVGITMTDFLSNGYTWNDLILFEDIGRKGATRAKQTLSIGLQTTANHFRDYPDALPYAKVAKHADLQAYDLCTHFGLSFETVRDEKEGPVPSALQCGGDYKWTARDCVRLGLKMDDLSKFGLILLQQYQDLMHGLSAPDAAAAERDLQVTKEHVDALEDVYAPAFAPDPTPAPVIVPQVQQPQRVVEPVAAPAPVVVIREEPAPAPAPRVVVVERPVLVVQRQPVVVAATQKRAQAPAKSTKFDRHGALILK